MAPASQSVWSQPVSPRWADSDVRSACVACARERVRRSLVSRTPKKSVQDQMFDSPSPREAPFKAYWPARHRPSESRFARSRRQFDHGEGPEGCGNSPRPDVATHAEHAPVFRHELHVDCEAHGEGVNRSARCGRAARSGGSPSRRRSGGYPPRSCCCACSQARATKILVEEEGLEGRSLPLPRHLVLRSRPLRGIARRHSC